MSCDIINWKDWCELVIYHGYRSKTACPKTADVSYKVGNISTLKKMVILSFQASKALVETSAINVRSYSTDQPQHMVFVNFVGIAL